MPSTNPRIHPYISEDCYVRLQALAQRPGRNESEIVDKAIAAFFSREHEDKRDGALIRRLDRMTRQMEQLGRKQIIAAEAFALFMRYFLTVVPPVSEQDKRAAQAQGEDRFATYLASLRRVLEDGEKVLFNSVEDALVDDSAFFTSEELARLHQPGPDRVPRHTSKGVRIDA